MKAMKPASPIKASDAVCYVIGSYESNGMKSKNPHAGIYETEVSKTLDAANCCYPACHQGGLQ